MVYAQNPALPPSSSTQAIETLKRKDFSKIEIEKLLQAVININPYMMPQRQVMTYWKAVSQELHDDDKCLDCTHEVLKNKVMQLLAWVKTKDSDWEKTKAVSDLLCANCRHTICFHRLSSWSRQESLFMTHLWLATHWNVATNTILMIVTVLTRRTWICLPSQMKGGVLERDHAVFHTVDLRSHSMHSVSIMKQKYTRIACSILQRSLLMHAWSSTRTYWMFWNLSQSTSEHLRAHILTSW